MSRADTADSEPRASPDGRARRMAWRLMLATTGVTTAVAWHISTFWLYRETLFVPAAVLGALFLLVLALRGIARATPASSRTRAMHVVARLDGVGLVFVAAFLVLALLFHVGFERAAADGRSYFIQVRSMVLDRDVDFTNDEAAFGGHGADRYPIGAPILWSPFFVAAHGWLHVAGLLGADVRTDGYYYPYQRAIGLATLIYGFLGLVLAYRVVRAYVARGPAALATLGLCATTFLIWYLTVENSMTHGVSMFSTTLFLYLWHRARPAPARGQWVALGAAAGLMTMVRWQNAVFVVFPLLDLLWRTRTPPAHAHHAGAAAASGVRTADGPGWRDAAIGLVAFTLAAVVTFAPQLIAWQSIYGSWLHVPAGEHAFTPALVPPHLIDVLFSSNRGLLTWTPVIWASLAGLMALAWRQPRIALVLIGAFVAQLWVNAAVDTWWGGAGFGARRFANCTLIFVMGLAAALAVCQRRPLLLPSLALAGLLALNGAFMLGYRDRTIGVAEAATFDDIMDEVSARIGNPFSLPVGAWLAWRYDVSPAVFDRQRGRTYTDLTIDVGGEGDDAFLGRGWSAREVSPDGSFRWSDADTSTLLVPLANPQRDYVLEIDWTAFSDASLGPQVVSVELNGTVVASVRLDGGTRHDVITLPATELRRKLNHLRFSYRYAVSPAALGLSEDARTLAVQVGRIRLRPTPAGGRPR